MDKNHGYVRLYRSLLDWGWYSDANTARVFIHCILKANYTEKEWKGIKISAGSFVTSLKSLSKELKLSIDKIRTAIKHLNQTQEITYKGYASYSIITINNYEYYQQNPSQHSKQTPYISHTNPKEIPTTNIRNKEIKEEYNVKEIFKNLEEKYKDKL